MADFVYTNFPGWNTLADTAANDLGEGHRLHMPLRAIVHGLPAATHQRVDELPDALVWPKAPVDGLQAPWNVFREAKGVPDNATPTSSVGAALEAYWMLFRCRVLVVWLDNETDIITLIAQASMAGMPVVIVTQKYIVDPVIASMCTVMVPPRRSIIYAVTSALVLQQRGSSEGSPPPTPGE